MLLHTSLACVHVSVQDAMQHHIHALAHHLEGALVGVFSYPTPRWPVYVFCAGALTCLLFSSVCHLLGCCQVRSCRADVLVRFLNNVGCLNVCCLICPPTLVIGNITQTSHRHCIMHTWIAVNHLSNCRRKSLSVCASLTTRA